MAAPTKVIINGKEYYSISHACACYHISPYTAHARVRNKGWDLAKAITTPVGKHREVEDLSGVKFDSLSQLAKAYKLTPSALYNRVVVRKWDLKDALTVPMNYRTSGVPRKIGAQPSYGRLSNKVRDFHRGLKCLKHYVLKSLGADENETKTVLNDLEKAMWYFNLAAKEAYELARKNK